MDVADVHVAENRIVCTHFSEQTSVLLTQDLRVHNSGALSDTILATSREVLSGFKAAAEKLGASDYRGVATAVFRKATNGLEYLQSIADNLNIRVQIISQGTSSFAP